MSNYRDELVQVAAVAVAALHDDIYGSTAMEPNAICMQTDHILGLILAERRRQEKKWGAQQHPKEKWITILGEEFGETARAVLENK